MGGDPDYDPALPSLLSYYIYLNSGAVVSFQPYGGASCWIFLSSSRLFSTIEALGPPLAVPISRDNTTTLTQESQKIKFYAHVRVFTVFTLK
jgi:hypothetical protein